jgi:tetratricopeptide (TPR) repeat protein
MDIIAQLNDLAEKYDAAAMETLVESLSPAQLAEYRPAVIEAYETVYSYGVYDLSCGKISDPEDFGLYLLDLLDTVQRFYPDMLYYDKRGDCYQELAAAAIADEDRLRYIQEAIHYFSIAPQTTVVQISMTDALLDKMEITNQFTTEAFTELLYFFRPLLQDISAVKSLIHQCFRVRALPFEQHDYWFRRLLSEFESAMYALAADQPLLLLDWAEAYHYILFNDHPEIEPAYKTVMVAQTVSLLGPLADYQTTDAELLNRLGKAFADTGKRADSLAHFQQAVAFFTRGHEQQPAAWTFPVYATNALLAIADRYYAQGEYDKVISTFEQGHQLFSQVYKHEEDFQLNLYWGDFLLAYTRLAHNYRSATINRLAEEKLQLAAVLGRNFYSHPYFSMARLAIKSGDPQKCVKILLECRDVIRGNGFDGYDLGEAINDDDFKAIKAQLESR